MEYSNYIQIVSIAGNFTAVFFAAYLGARYFIRQQKVLRLEKYFYDEGLFKAEEIFLNQSSAVIRLNRFICIKLDNLPLRIREGTINSDEVEQVFVELKDHLMEINSLSLNFSYPILRANSFIQTATGYNFLIKWVQFYENNQANYTVAVNRLIDSMKDENKKNGSRVDFSNKIIINLEVITDLFHILMQMPNMTIAFSLLKEELLEATISNEGDIYKVLSKGLVKEHLETIKYLFEVQCMVYEVDGDLYPVGTMNQGLYLKRVKIKIHDLNGEFPGFIISEYKDISKLKKVAKRLYTYEELQSLASVCFNDKNMTKKVNFIRDYINVNTAVDISK